MHPIIFCNSIPDFTAKVSAEFQGLPPLLHGDDIYDLCHFSRDGLGEIEEGRVWKGLNGGPGNWSNRISSDITVLGYLNGLHGRGFKYLYLLRSALRSSDVVRRNDAGFEEFAIQIDATTPHLACLSLQKNGGHYEVVKRVF